MDTKLVAGAALAGALEVAGHWTPWPQPLHRIGAYAYGVAAILAGVAVATDRRTTEQVAAISATAGAATVAAYAVDHLLKARQRRRIYGRHA